MKALTLEQLSRIVSEIRTNGYPTGSKVFGVETVNSDTDFVMTYDEAWRLFTNVGLLHLAPIEIYALGFRSQTYKLHNELVNLIIVQTEFDLLAWEYATTEMLKMDKEIIRIKTERTKYFGFLLTEFYRRWPLDYKKALEIWGEGYIPRTIDEYLVEKIK